MPLRLVALALALALTAGTSAADAQISPPSRSAELPSVSLPPELDRVLRDYEAAWRQGDAAALASLFAEDGFVLQGGRPPVRGRAAIEAAYAGQSGGPLRLRAFAAAAEDTVAYIIGAYGYGDAPGDQGKFTLTLRRQRGRRWLIFSDMDNSSRPPRKQALRSRRNVALQLTSERVSRPSHPPASRWSRRVNAPV